MNTTKYLQTDGRWGGLGYPKKPCYIRNVGCGEVAIANSIIEMEQYKNYTPATIQPYCKQYGEKHCNGTFHSGIPAMMKHYGMTEVMEHATMGTLWKELAKGNRIALYLMGSRKGGSKGVHWTSSGHFVMSSGYKFENGKHWVYVKDSYSNSSLRNKWISYEGNMRNDVVKVWSGKLNGKPTPTPTPTPKGKLVVDGIGGTATVKAMQKFFGTPVDGIISGQNKKQSVYYPALDAVQFGRGGSPCIKKLQEWCGVTQDGIIGRGTTCAWQKRLRDEGYLAKNETIDGYFGVKSMKAWQKYLNDQNAKPTPKPTPTPTPTPTPVPTPTASEYKVIDVSSWQGYIDWAKVRADGVVGAIIRYADGDIIDSRFDENMKNAKAAGLHIGSYIFSRAKTKAQAEEEATRLFNACKPYAPDMPLYIDLEAKGLSKYANTVAQAFIAKIKALGGKPGVYANLNWWNNYLQPTAKLSFAMWLAQYNKTMDYKPKSYVGMWQYSSSGKVSGISGKVDMDKCYIAYWDEPSVTPTPAPTPTPTPTPAPTPVPTPQSKICSVAKEIADDVKYKYIPYAKAYAKKCGFCKPIKDEGSGGNCIDFAFHCWHVVNGCKCSFQTMTNQLYEKLLKVSASEALEIVQGRTGLKDIKVLVDKGGISISKLKPGDIVVYFSGNTYKHTALYIGDGKIADCTSGRKDAVKYGVKSYSKWKIKVAIRYTGK